MTTIAWDGRLLACDSQSSSNGEKHEILKMYKVPQGIAVTCGVFCYAMEIIQWLRSNNLDVSEYPQFRFGKDEDAAYVVVATPAKDILVYEWYSYMPLRINNKVYAKGNGSMAATAAMLCGRSSMDAIRIASEIDVHTGGDIWCGDPISGKITKCV